MSGRKRERPPLYFAGVVIEGLPSGGTTEQAQALIADRLAQHVARQAQQVKTVAVEAAD
ncbi:hypothetical protein [Deinococcus sp. KSM4-11]|uniref:hypothetical protein n=1 Tax=Deinococcus sp. KSM4-11 TaxID=2568654 RepID=UPI001454BE9F|nr:hypothetical protein [Deinococcus sp. KSM4-11]